MLKRTLRQMSCTLCSGISAYVVNSTSYSYACLECDIAGGLVHSRQEYASSHACKCGNRGTRIVRNLIRACYQCILDKNLDYTVNAINSDGAMHIVRVRSNLSVSRVVPAGHDSILITYHGNAINASSTFADHGIAPGSTLNYSSVYWQADR